MLKVVKTVSGAPSSGVAVLWDGMVVSRAADTEVVGKEGGNVGDDGHERAVQGTVACGSHGDDDVVLVPHVEGVWV